MIKELEQNVCQLKQQLQESELQRKQQLKVSPVLLNRTMAKSHLSFSGCICVSECQLKAQKCR